MTKTYIIQHLPSSGDFDYSEYASTEAAWEAEKGESWVQTAMEEGDKTLEECREEFASSLREYTEQEVLKAHEDGYTWPTALGLVDFHGEDDFTGEEHAFNLSGKEIEDGMVKATIVTAHGAMEIAEHINDDGKVERTDSNIRINQIVSLAELFNRVDYAGLTQAADYVPLKAIWDALEA